MIGSADKTRGYGVGITLLLRRIVSCVLVVLVGPFLDANAVAQTPAGPRDSVEELLVRRIAALQAQLDALDTQIRRLKDRVPAIQTEIERLTQEVGTLQVPQAEEEEAEAERPREVPFRPPLLRETEKDASIAIVCQDGRAMILDLDEYGSALDNLTADQDRLSTFLNDGGGTFSAGDFEIRVSLIDIGGGFVALVPSTVSPRAGQTGDTLESCLRASSRLRRKLAGLDPDQTVIQFAVYPDSFNEFRELRSSLVWSAGFGVNWIAMKHNEPISLGSGSLSEQ